MHAAGIAAVQGLGGDWRLHAQNLFWRAAQCVLVARMTLEDEWIAEHARHKGWSHRRLWLGLPSDKEWAQRRRRQRERRAAAKEARRGAARDLELGRA